MIFLETKFKTKYINEFVDLISSLESLISKKIGYSVVGDNNSSFIVEFNYIFEENSEVRAVSLLVNHVLQNDLIFLNIICKEKDGKK